MNKPLPFLLSAALFLFACSSSQTAGPESAAGASEASLPSSASSARDLTRQATFSDIVAAAETTAPSKAPSCLLAGPGADDGWYLGTGFASPLRPLPKPSSDLFTQVMREGDSVLLLSQHGLVGAHGMTFVALTEVPRKPNEPARLMIITPSGIFVRRTDERSHEGPVPLDQVDSLITANAFRDAPLYLSADAETPIQVIAHILKLASQQQLERVGFALALPEGTRLPELPAAGPSPFACKGDPEVGSEGSLDPQQIVSSMAPLSEAAQRCFDMLPYEEQRDRTAQLRVTVGPDGRVQQACFLDDSSRSTAALDHCLVDQARRLNFPEPSPAGELVFVAPFRFTPRPLPQTQPLCPASHIQP